MTGVATLPAGVEVLTPSDAEVLSADALAFVALLQRELGPPRADLLARRAAPRGRPAFLAETRSVREGEWMVAAPPADLLDRRVEITGPVERKMMINALNSGARVFMADFEDACSAHPRPAPRGCSPPGRSSSWPRCIAP